MDIGRNLRWLRRWPCNAFPHRHGALGLLSLGVEGRTSWPTLFTHHLIHRTLETIAYELAVFIGTLAAIITRELSHGDHLLAKPAEFVREIKDDNLVTWFVWRYTTCEICLSGMLGMLSAFVLTYLGCNPFTALTIPVYAMLAAGIVRRYVF